MQSALNLTEKQKTPYGFTYMWDRKDKISKITETG